MYASLLMDLFFYLFEADFMQELFKTKEKKLKVPFYYIFIFASDCKVKCIKIRKNNEMYKRGILN